MIRAVRRAALLFVAVALWTSAAHANELCVWEIDVTGACVCVPIPCPIDCDPVSGYTSPSIDTPVGEVPQIYVGPPPDNRPCRRP